jgi:hypothetical protein
MVWLLLGLTLVPALAGAARLVSLATGLEIIPDGERFFSAPIPVVVHIIGSVLFLGLGAFQFVDRVRRDHPRRHRIAGRVVAAAGMASALSGLWMTLFYALPAYDGFALYLMRLMFGTAMAALLVLGVVCAMQRSFSAHRAHMMRAYAIGMGAGTQVVTSVPLAILGMAEEVGPRAFAMGMGWVVNLLVVEWILRRQTRRAAPIPVTV